MNKKYSILKHCELIQSGVENYQGRKDYVATGDVINNQIIDVTPYSNDDRPSRANMNVKTNDIIFARMKNTTKVLLITSKESKQIFSTGFAILRPDMKKINPRYVMHICKSKEFQKTKDKFAHGDTQKSINNYNIAKLQISIPSLDEQNYIVNILDCIERINTNRVLTFDLIQQFTKSYFTKIYQSDKKNGFKETIGNLCKKIKRYPTFYGLKYIDRGVPIIKIGNISKNGKLQNDLTNYDFVEKEISDDFPETILEYHDLLMAVRGDGSAGKLGYVSDKKFVGANISPNLLRISTNTKKTNPIFLYHLLSSDYGKSLINGIVNRTAKKTISAEDFKNIELYLPPIEIQNKFEQLICHLDAYLLHCEESHEKSKEIDFVMNRKLLKVNLIN